MIEMAYDKLCADGWLPSNACGTRKITYEVTDEGRGWYLFHHHHFHVDFHGTNSRSLDSSDSMSQIPGGNPDVIREFYRQQRANTLLPIAR